jgi:uncharacterized membrane protein YbhN (UPF0104 family)
MSRGARSTWVWLRPLGGAAILAVLVWRLGAGPFLDGVRGISASALVAATSITALTTVCSAWRWQTVARGLGIQLALGTAVAAYYRSQFLNSALPGGVVGDVHRGVRHGLAAGDLGRGLRAVWWERTAGSVVFAVVALVVLFTFDSPVHPAMGWVLSAAAVGALGVAVLLRALRGDGSSRRARVLRTARSDVRHGLLDRRSWPVVALTSVVVALGHAGIFLVAAAATGAHASVARLWPLAMLVLLATLIPLSIGGWGPREGAATYVFAAAGLGSDQGIATATAFGVLGLVATIPGGLVLALGQSRRSRTRPRAALDTNAGDVADVPAPLLVRLTGADHVEGEQHVLAGEEDRSVDQPNAVGDAIDAQQPDRLDARADDRR